MATPQQVLDLAAKQIGIQGTDNKFNTWYWGRRCYNPSVYPWCAAFQSWLADQVGGLGYQASASVSGICNQLTRVNDADARPGDYVMFNWDGRTSTGFADHIGIIEWTDINGSGYFGTIEGNTGGVYGGKVARVTRYNYGSYFTAFYRPVYNGKNSSSVLDIPPVKYRVFSGGRWLNEIVDRYDTGGSGDTFAGNGQPFTYLAMDMPGWYQVRVRNRGWLSAIRRYDINDREKGCAGNGSEITGVRCYYETPDPDKTGWLQIRYAVAPVGKNFLPEMEDLVDLGGSGNNYAGNGSTLGAFYAYPVRM